MYPAGSTGSTLFSLDGADPAGRIGGTGEVTGGTAKALVKWTPAGGGGDGGRKRGSVGGMGGGGVL